MLSSSFRFSRLALSVARNSKSKCKGEGNSRFLRWQQVRNLNLHEYQSAQIMKEAGVNVPFGIPASTVAEAVAAGKEIGDEEVVIKSQILAGGRGLGSFLENGLQGGVHIIKTEEIGEYAGKMLNKTLVTKQSGAKGKPVDTVLIAKKMKLKREFYFSIIMDRASQGPLVIASAEGGTSIEDLAKDSPEKIITVPVDLEKGITQDEIDKIVDAYGISDREDAGQQIKALYDLFVDKDCTMVEVNPLAEDDNGRLLAADAKIAFDDNAAFRQTDVHERRDRKQEDPREVAAAEFDLNYIGLDGNIGCMVNGAGLAMATMDIVDMHGGSPANFLDVGGGAKPEQIKAAFEIITADPNVRCVLVNIFGGIMRCDVIAQGIVAASKDLDLKIPVVVRLEGTNVDLGKKMLSESGLDLISADDLDDAAKKAVASF